jgi:hypothetical protein
MHPSRGAIDPLRTNTPEPRAALAELVRVTTDGRQGGPLPTPMLDRRRCRAGGEECQLICGDISIEVECGSNGRAELRLLLVEQHANPVSQSLDRDRGDVVAADN